ncbi:MAG: FAD-binding oxidoreductase [Gemmataceae bacterium]|nr:FAD-binding oxidoreductase [Gemmataceae bacterium]
MAAAPTLPYHERMNPAASDPCTIDGLALPIVRPASAAELGDLVRQGQPLYPVGGRTQLHVGLPPSRPGVAVDTTALDAVIDYPARDMTITVGAGIRLHRLQAILAGQGQRLPIDVPLPHLATLGGSIAANVSGPRRYGQGTLRDYVIGISVVGDTGEETKAGGRVVKNVAGYDLCKLHTGAFGTLGIITQATLKVRPLPEAMGMVVVGCHESVLHALLDALHESRTRPACIEAVSRLLAEPLGLAETEWSVVVGYEDSEPAVGWQVGQLIEELDAAGFKGAEVRFALSAAPLWQALTDLTLAEGERLAWKASMLPGQVAQACRGFTRIHAHAGNGIVWGRSDASTEEEARKMLSGLPGTVTLTRCPTEWKRSLPVWGKPRGDLALMRRVKAALDPRDLFNPGRFLDSPA